MPHSASSSPPPPVPLKDLPVRSPSSFDLDHDLDLDMDGKPDDNLLDRKSHEPFRDDIDGDTFDKDRDVEDPWTSRHLNTLRKRPRRIYEAITAALEPRRRLLAIVLAAVFSFSLIMTIIYANRGHIVYILSPDSGGPVGPGESSVVWNTHWEKPKDFKIVAFIFYGRRHTVDVLDCYLRQNMASSGGYLDEVHFMQHTDNEDDIAWLKDFVRTRPGYIIIDEVGITKACGSDDNCWPSSYSDIWKHATDNNTLYLKIDDDVIYIEENAIPSIVHTRMRHPDAYVIFANVVNNAMSAFGQYIMGAYHAYLPEPVGQSGENPKFNGSWRASDLPTYPRVQIADEFDEEHMQTTQGYRWLPLRKDTPDVLRQTPVRDGPGYDPYDRAWSSGAIAAQAHYSLLQNIEENALRRYWYGDSGTGVWDVHQAHYSVNFIAVWGRDIAATTVSNDDEVFLTVDEPKRLNRPTYADSRSIVAHLHYNTQTDAIMTTDLLDRYIAYANERVCAADNKKTKLV